MMGNGIPEGISLGKSLEQIKADLLKAHGWRLEEEAAEKKKGYAAKEATVAPGKDHSVRQIQLSFENGRLTYFEIKFRTPDPERAKSLFRNYAVAFHCDFKTFDAFHGWFLIDRKDRKDRRFVIVADDGNDVAEMDVAKSRATREIADMRRTYTNPHFCAPQSKR